MNDPLSFKRIVRANAQLQEFHPQRRYSGIDTMCVQNYGGSTGLVVSYSYTLLNGRDHCDSVVTHSSGSDHLLSPKRVVPCAEENNGTNYYIGGVIA